MSREQDAKRVIQWLFHWRGLRDPKRARAVRQLWRGKSLAAVEKEQQDA